MEALAINNTPDKLQITFDKRFFDETFLRETIEFLRTEYLAQRVDFDESVEDLGKEIKHSWWQRSKNQYIQEK